MKITIAYDIDDTTLECYVEMQKYLNNLYGDIGSFEEHTKYFIESKNATQEEILQSIKDFISTKYLKPLNNSFHYIKMLYHHFGDTEVLFITHRQGGNTVEMSHLNIQLYMGNIPFSIISAESRPKEYYLKRDKVKYFVDDRFRTCNEVAGTVERVFCINRPWNQGREFSYNNIIRVNSIKEVSDVLMKG